LLSLIRDHAATAVDFASVRFSVCGGDKVSGELAGEYLALTGRMIDEVYGMTEIGTAMCTPATGPVRVGSVGPLAPGFTAELRDAEGREVRRGDDGRLWLRAPSVMVGYWNAPAATAEVLRDGWIDTGDLMRADADGHFWFRGRLKQLIIHDGSNIAPQEVEEALLAHAAVAAAGVVGIHNPLHGETVRAYVAARDPAAPPTAQALIDFVRVRIAAYKAPEEIVFLPELPLNPTGKVDRARLKRMAETAAGAA
jgi:acyl-coenzyme A synthetase/AMP-(fatty) acid ligase